MLPFYGTGVKRDSGKIYVKNELIDERSFTKRSVEDSVRHIRRKRDARPVESLSIKAWSGKPNSLFSITNVTIEVAGVAAPPTGQNTQTPGR